MKALALRMRRAGLLFLSGAPAIGSKLAEHEPVASGDPCADFDVRSWNHTAMTPFWEHVDCVRVWNSWARTLPLSLHRAYPDRLLLREHADELRRRGSPCLVDSVVSSDGVGSTIIRHLSAWMLAQEVGCDWLTPTWGKARAGSGGGSSLYCHMTATLEEINALSPNGGDRNASLGSREAMIHRCSMANWLEFFNLAKASVSAPTSGIIRVIEADSSSPTQLEEAVHEMVTTGLDNLQWDTLKLVLDRAHASNYLAALRSWDERKRQVVRETLNTFRENFAISPRPWHIESPHCEYHSSGLNFALHVRMGDRKAIEGVTLEYFELLDAFMDVVTRAVLKKGHAAPTFHVFSETLWPCPSMATATFDEFPLWPVHRDQVPTCLAAETPPDCVEKTLGAEYCRPIRSGIFRVQDRQLVLHVGQDVANTLSCMIKADGLLMGCSTFGQVAGILNGEGISFFSTSCDGLGTAVQYKMIPPLAVVEGGRLWVPVSGSWRDPVLESTYILDNALEELFRVRAMSV